MAYLARWAGLFSAAVYCYTGMPASAFVGGCLGTLLVSCNPLLLLIAAAQCLQHCEWLQLAVTLLGGGCALRLRFCVNGTIPLATYCASMPHLRGLKHWTHLLSSARRRRSSDCWTRTPPCPRMGDPRYSGILGQCDACIVPEPRVQVGPVRPLRHPVRLRHLVELSPHAFRTDQQGAYYKGNRNLRLAHNGIMHGLISQVQKLLILIQTVSFAVYVNGASSRLQQPLLTSTDGTVGVAAVAAAAF